MTAPHPEIIIIRRRGSIEDEHHGGAWKIAFADFMTAMMAFFLVLWIISATDKNTKTVIARYFNPVKVEEPAKSQKGIRGAPEPDASAQREDETTLTARKSASPKGALGRGDMREQQPVGPSDATEQNVPPHSGDKAPPDAARPTPTMSEQQLFTDPRASLDKIAGVAEPSGPRADFSSQPQGFGEVGPAKDGTIRDPFRPLGNVPPDMAASEAPAEAQAAAGGERPVTKGQAAADLAPTGPQKEPPAFADAKVSQRPASQAKSEQPPPESKTAAPPDDARREAAARLLAEVKDRLGAETRAFPGPQLDIQATDEGILISLTDRQNFSMFAIGSAEPQPRMLRMMDAIATSLKAMPGPIVLRGHTDAHPYRSPTYDNWRLSAARAQMAYYMLNRAGIPEKRFDGVEGFADRRLRDPAHPLAAENRRIEILLREAKP